MQLLQASSEARIQLQGLVGASDSFVIKSVFSALSNNFLVVANDKEDAAYLQNNIAALFEKKTIRFFPDSFKRPMFFEELNRSNV
ncbi:MAG: hypothetical protein AAFU60_02770, partial [Bacteroidota bacterium]